MIDNAALEKAHGPAQFSSICAHAPGAAEDAQIFLCRDGQGARDPRPCRDPYNENYGAVWMNWWVHDVDAAHAECLNAKVEVIRAPVNEPWGVREFLIRYADGHYFRVSGPMTRYITGTAWAARASLRGFPRFLAARTGSGPAA